MSKPKIEVNKISIHRIKRLRARKKLTQSDLAELAGIGITTVHEIETGKRGLSDINAEKIADALNVDVGYLTGEQDHESRYDLIAKQLRESRHLKSAVEDYLITCGYSIGEKPEYPNNEIIIGVPSTESYTLTLEQFEAIEKHLIDYTCELLPAIIASMASRR